MKLSTTQYAALALAEAKVVNGGLCYCDVTEIADTDVAAMMWEHAESNVEVDCAVERNEQEQFEEIAHRVAVALTALAFGD